MTTSIAAFVALLAISSTALGEKKRIIASGGSNSIMAKGHLIGNPAPASSPYAQIGDYLYLGVRYLNARASLAHGNPDKIRIQGYFDGKEREKVEIPWAKAPADLQKRLSLMREAAIARAKQLEADKAAGIETLEGKVLVRTATGFLIQTGRDEVVHITGKTDLADGERFKGKVKRADVYQYQSQGELITVKNYVN